MTDRHNVIAARKQNFQGVWLLHTNPESSSNRKLRLLLPVAATKNACGATLGSGLLCGAKLRVICECLKVLTLIS